MEKLSESQIINIIQKRYKKRLAEVAIKASLEETDIYDDKGNMLLAKDLKVRHKNSGYEYTVDHVEGEGDSAVVYLRHPDEPRILPPDATTALQEAETTVSLNGVNFDNIAHGAPLDDIKMPEKIDLDQEELEKKSPASLLSVPKKEFEDEYEVQ
jgi:hypothetical protein